MNNRIKELAEQAKNYAYRAVMGGEECQEAYTKKFAELLIRECLDVVAGHCGGDTDSEPVKIFLDIEKHFGVDENS